MGDSAQLGFLSRAWKAVLSVGVWPFVILALANVLVLLLAAQFLRLPEINSIGGGVAGRVQCKAGECSDDLGYALADSSLPAQIYAGVLVLVRMGGWLLGGIALVAVCIGVSALQARIEGIDW
eukprot:TRINITY_DN26878_c0_g1_i2.p2 TRINITY_DN26878_c0_g1~~TRINITY_DN26878_c0_g1_i2.p2  ORF type:complete len:137 (-),score=2.79 TRINITY_DN26878_c0_g1_i2:170-538(-)